MTEMRPWAVPVTASDLKSVLTVRDDDIEATDPLLGLILYGGRQIGKTYRVAAILRAKELVRVLSDRRLSGLVMRHGDGEVSIAEPLLDLAATHPLDPTDGLRTASFFSAAARLTEACHG